MRKVLWSVCFAILLFISCTKENLRTQSPGLLVKKVQRNSNNDTHTFAYSYDNQNRLTHIKVSGSSYSWRAVTEIQYDMQGQLHKSVYYQINDSNVVTNQSHSYSFVYDNNNRIVRQIYTALSTTTIGGEDHSFGYDAQGRLIADTTIADQNGGVERYSVFVYDSNNNVIEIKEHYGSGAAPLYTYYITYDNKQNPYTNFTDLNTNFYLVSSDIHNLNANNVIRMLRSGDAPSIYKHEYGPSGQLKSSITFPENYPQFTSSMEYFFTD